LEVSYEALSSSAQGCGAAINRLNGAYA
jgi:hypothetical protein